MSAARPRKIWGWGYEGEGADARALAFAEASLGALFGGVASRAEPLSAAAVSVAPPRLLPPSSLEALFDTTKHERLVHAFGRSYRDIARAVRGDFGSAPDLVAFPKTEADVARLLDFAAEEQVAVVPFGGGTCVSGGVEPVVGDAYRATLSLDLRDLSGVEEIDRESLSARIQGGTLGPSLEAELKNHGLTLRHFPQSFEMSTLGGWIVTRAGGHFATVYTHIDDLVESVRVVTPAGTLETRRLPGSGSGPAPERLFLGSEGALGIVTSAWMKVFERPDHRAHATVRFDTFDRGLDAMKRIVQSGLFPANCRLVDPAEAIMSGAGAGDASLLFVGFESSSLDLTSSLNGALELARAAGGVHDAAVARTATAGRDATADTYKSAFFRAPYLRDEIILRGVFVETYETAAPWSKIAALDEAVRAAVARLELGPHMLARRVTHAYRDGCAPYYTLITKERSAPDHRLWDDVKNAVTDAVLGAGGTCTHHHAIGRDLMPWYQKERPPLFATAFAAAKTALDPRWVMNPGVLLRAPDATS